MLPRIDSVLTSDVFLKDILLKYNGFFLLHKTLGIDNSIFQQSPSKYYLKVSICFNSISFLSPLGFEYK